MINDYHLEAMFMTAMLIVIAVAACMSMLELVSIRIALETLAGLQ